MQKIKKLISANIQTITYLLFGGLTTFVNWSTYCICMKFSLSMNLSNCISWIVSVSFAFITNRRFVFKGQAKRILSIVKECLYFFCTRLLSGAFEMACLPFLIRIGLDQSLFHIKGFPAKIITSFIVLVINYIGSKLIWRSTPDK